MKILVQWSTSAPWDWEEYDSSQWASLPRKGEPGPGRGPVDSERGWVNAFCVQGDVFRADRIGIRDLPGGALQVITVDDDPEDYAPGDRRAEVYTYRPLAPDPLFRGAYNTRTTLEIYAGSDLRSRLPERMQTPGGPVAIHPFEDFVEPADVLFRYGKWLPDELFELHRKAATPRLWREWTDGVPASELDETGKVRVQASLGRYPKPKGTLTYYQSNATLASGVHTAVHETALRSYSASNSNLSRTVPTSTAELVFLFTSLAGEPNNASWPTGTYRCQIDATTVDANLSFGLLTIGGAAGHFGRVDSGLTTDLQTHAQVEAAFTAAGLHLATTGSVSFNSGSPAASDRFECLIAVQNSNGHNTRTITIDVNDPDQFADGPWVGAVRDRFQFPWDMGLFEDPGAALVSELYTWVKSPTPADVVPVQPQAPPVEFPEDIGLFTPDAISAEVGMVRGPTPEDFVEPQAPYVEFPTDEGLLLPDPIGAELGTFRSPLADDNEGAFADKVTPEDIGLFTPDPIQAELEATRGPTPDDVHTAFSRALFPTDDFWFRPDPIQDEQGVTRRPTPPDFVEPQAPRVEFPTDLGLYTPDALQAELGMVRAPLADDNEGAFADKVAPEDIGLFTPDPIQAEILSTRAPTPDDVHTAFSRTLFPTDDFWFRPDPIQDEQGVTRRPTPPDFVEPQAPRVEFPTDLGLYTPDAIQAELGIVGAPKPADNAEAFGSKVFPQDLRLYLPDPLQAELGMVRAPLADDNEGAFGNKVDPEDLGQFAPDPIEAEQTWLHLAPAFEVPTPPSSEYPDDIGLLTPGYIQDEFTFTRSTPPADNEMAASRQSFPTDAFWFQPGELPRDWTSRQFEEPAPEEPPSAHVFPTDLALFDTPDITDVLTVTRGPAPAEVGNQVNVEIVVEPVVKAGDLIPFTIVVTNGFGFADADFDPTSIVFKRTALGPFLVHDAPLITKRPGTTGLYDGSFTADAIAAGGAPEVYPITADVTLGVDARRWTESTMAIGPC